MKEKLVLSNLPEDLEVQEIVIRVSMFGRIKFQCYQKQARQLIISFEDVSSYQQAMVLDNYELGDYRIKAKIIEDDQDSDYEMILTKSLSNCYEQHKQDDYQSSHQKSSEFVQSEYNRNIIEQLQLNSEELNIDVSVSSDHSILDSIKSHKSEIIMKSNVQQQEQEWDKNEDEKEDEIVGDRVVVKKMMRSQTLILLMLLWFLNQLISHNRF